MSDRGSILISTANDIGEALVEKLGGEGYAPAVWDKEYNKLGIAEVDSAPALSVLEDSSETGTARGSILLSTANAIGAMLNKKYNTDRGFKPKEWASAGRKMKALETDTKSGSIVNIQGAKETPLLSLVATISPTSSGVSSVTETQTGKTVFLPMDIEQGTISGSGYNSDSTARIRTAERKAVSPSTLYKIKVNSEVQIYEVHEYTDLTGSSTHLTVNASEYTFTTKSTTNYLRILFRYSNNATIRPSAITELQVTDGVLCWNTYTADLGETIHGGKVDFIKGEVTDAITETKTFTGATSEVWQYSSAYGWFYIDNQFSDAYRNNQEKDFMACNLGTQQAYANVTVLPNMTFACTSGTNSRFVFKNTDYDNVDDFKAWLSSNNMVVAYRKSDFVPFSITPIEINTSGDVENYYTSAGDTSIEYYAVPTPYTRGTSSGAIANVQSARTDLPFTKVKANIAPNLTGVESVEVTKAGKNLFNKENPNEVDGYITTTGFSTSNTSAKTIYIPIVGGATYTVSKAAGQRFSLATAEVIPSNNAVFTGRQANNTATSISITAGANDKYLWAWIYLDGTDTGTLNDMISSIQIEVGSSATEYTPYEEPTVYTADLGEPINGGSVDLVSGEVKEYPYSDLGERSILRDPNRTGVFYCYIPGRVSGSYVLGCNKYTVMNIPVSTSYDKYVSGVNSYGGNYIFFRDTSLAGLSDAELAEALTGTLISYDNGNIVTRNIAPQVISPSDGVNNLWNNAGGDTDVEYFEQE